MAIIRYFFVKGEVPVLFLSDVYRLTDMIEEHMRNNLANIYKLNVMYHLKHKYGLIDFICDSEVDEQVVIPYLSFVVNNVYCKIGFALYYD
jgi:hypothetical protein